ncbi:initiation factor 2 [Xylariaceae sp. FL0594]|nr:initiation factor 2 [Xylariaceae sp. FL0594]
MFGGRLAKRDSSICAYCLYRASLQQPRAPQTRALSIKAPCGSDIVHSSSRSLAPLRITHSGRHLCSSSSSAPPSTRPFSTGVTLRRPDHGSVTPRGPPSLSFPRRSSPATPSGPPSLGFQIKSKPIDDLLESHEAQAREKLLAQKKKEQEQLSRGFVDPRVKARYVWDSERQQSIEKFLEAESSTQHSDPSKLRPPPTTLPGSPFSTHSGSPSIRSALNTKPASEGPIIRKQPARTPDRRFEHFRTDRHQVRPQPSSRTSSLPIQSTAKPADDANALKTETSSTAASGFAALEAAVAQEEHTREKNSGQQQEWGLLSRKPRFNRDSSWNDNGETSSNSWTSIRSGPWNSRSAPRHQPRQDNAERLSYGLDGSSSSRSQERARNVDRSDPDLWAITKENPADNGSSSRPRERPRDVQRPSPDPWSAAVTEASETSRNTVSQKQSGNGDRTSVDSRETGAKGRPTDNSFSRDRGFEGSRPSEYNDRRSKPSKFRDSRSRRESRFEDDYDQSADAEYSRAQERKREKQLRKERREAQRTEPVRIILPELIGVRAFAGALKLNPEEFLVQLGELGFEDVTLDSLMAGETAALVAQEYGYDPIVENPQSDLKPRPPPEDPSTLPERPPVVTIMGHVDHGKTTILDYLRKSSVAAQEHGGITQHIGAFSVMLSSGKPITFLDTPGHAAFLSMRQRGANVTDIVVLVVAADDSVKPQTLEAIKHAHAAKVPIIVAINKIDKDGARVDAVKHDLAKAGVEIEDFGGDVQVVCVSGKTGQGMDDLEENILTLSEILDHRAETDGQAEGWILESSIKLTGKVATVLVKRGTLRTGDIIAAGLTWAKIRQMRNEAGAEIKEAPPGTPVEIFGWKDLPAAGDQVIQAPDESRARAAVEYRKGLHEREKDAAEHEIITEARRALQEKRAREKELAEQGEAEVRKPQSSTGVRELGAEDEDGIKRVNVIVKGDVHGSVEAVCAAIQEIGNHEVRPRILRSGAGAITEFDVEHAALSNAMIINFATTTPNHVKAKAQEQGVRILDHNIIYRLVDDVRAKLSEYLAPDVTTRVLGEAEVLQVFPINLRGRMFKNIAGCRVRNGLVSKNAMYRILRGGKQVFEGKLETLKHIKKDVTEMRKGGECGMGFVDFQDIEVGDQVQAVEEVVTKRNL